MHYFINLIISVSLLFSVSIAQQSTKLDRSKPPKTENPKEIKFPKYEQAKLSNGMTLLLIENHTQPTVFISVTSRGGSYFDDAKPGLSSLVSALMTKGTATKNAIQIAETVDFLGAELTSTSSWDANRIDRKSVV